MSEATAPTEEATNPPGSPADASAEREAARKEDRSRLKRSGRLHFVMLMGAITLWGAADAWASVSGLGLAHLVAALNALVAATVATSIVHEWGHLAGARLAGAVSPALEKPVQYFFMFDFKFEENDSHQFLWMSWGGILAPWLLVLGVVLFVPIDSLGRVVLLAALVARAAQIALFEVPVARGTERGGDPRSELGRALKAGGLRTSRNRGTWIGIALGVVLLLAL